MKKELNVTAIREKIVEVALSYEGKTEFRGNAGFHDGDFQDAMEAVGWQKGQAWCAYFAELVWKEAYGHFESTDDEIAELDKLFSPGAVVTYNNFNKEWRHRDKSKKNQEFYEVSQEPKKGDLIVWQSYKNGKAHWTGHVGIVVGVFPDEGKVWTMEGNTNSKGGREGIEVAKKTRKVGADMFRPKLRGLVLKGFISPKVEIEICDC